MKSFWESIPSSIEEMRTLLGAHADSLGLEGSPGPLLEGEGEPHALLVIAIDSDAILSLAMVPARLVDERLSSALATIDNRTFAGAADLTSEQWDAAVLVLSALALEMSDADELAQWAQDEGSSLSSDDIASYWNRWANTSVSSWTELARSTSAIYSFRRAM